ncbi:unnamed protein product [Paramecium pentaurelia]|uniref:Uncharacterized protein n=1 Tax=Paramecium pentaurelia TaxID=43138 RepID=A0A8S1TDV1_9CILI|nr:unnamed protein product [Paramecium pentaurelia]
MPKLCEKINQFLRQHVVEKYLPLTSLVWNTKITPLQNQSHAMDYSTIYVKVHQHYLREMTRQQIINKQHQQITQVQEGGLTDFIQNKNQQRIFIIPTFDRQLSESNSTTQIHALQLINQKELETTYFSLEDIETTYSSYPEELNYSFIDESLIQTQ